MNSPRHGTNNLAGTICVFGRCVNFMGSHYEKWTGLKKNRAVSLALSPIVSHLFLIGPECKPFLLALDPDGLERIRQFHGFGM
jgi:hypothetical protein